MSEGVRKTRVELETVGAQNATRAVTDLEQKLKQTEQQAKQTQAAADRGRMESNLGQLKVGGGRIMTGPVQLGPRGFAISPSYFRGGTVVGGVMGGLMLADAVGQAGNQVADLIDLWNDPNVNITELAREAFMRGATGAIRTLSMPSVQTMIERLFGGASKEEAELSSELRTSFGGRTSFDEWADGQRARHRRAVEIRRQQDDLEAKRQAGIDARMAEALSKAEELHQKRLRGLKDLRNPVILPEDLYQLQRRMLRNLEELGHAAEVKRIQEAARQVRHLGE